MYCGSYMSLFKKGLNFYTSFLIGIVFLIVGVLTLPHYGINWDTINHLPRGQAYLHFFLTGKRDFSDLPRFFDGYQKPGQWYWQNPSSLSIDTDIPNNTFPRVSLYQKAGIDFNYLIENDAGHPPLSDILSSLFNVVLFQKLGLINDIDSYRVYGIILAAALVGLLFFWVSKLYGKITGFVATLSLSLYPLFWAESHFNTEKDIPETVYWSFLLFTVWNGVTQRSWKWILVSGVFFGLALGTKFNIVFIPFVIIPWIVIVGLHQKWFDRKLQFFKKNKTLLALTILAPILGLLIFIATWPYLWADPISRIGNIVGFYKDIGLTENIDSRFQGPFRMNNYPIQWILYTTPLATLFFALIGLGYALYRYIRLRDLNVILFLLWMVTPIARVTWPGTTVYGGIRQIMEYIPALAVFSGLGAFAIIQVAKQFRVSSVVVALLIALTFIPIVIRLVSIHPNENVYFNSLVGGLAGAKERNLPAWGNSFGAAYRQGVVWLNNNAEQDAKIAYAYELIPNIPRIFLRQDLDLYNRNRSGALRSGEYTITLTYQGTANRTYYDTYLERFLEPVYEVKVDGVSILKIWKNDIKHTKPGFIKEAKINNVKLEQDKHIIKVDLGRVYTISLLRAFYNEQNCTSLASAYSQISIDGINWGRLPGTMPDEDWNVMAYGPQPMDGKLIQPFAGERVRYIEYVVDPQNACLKNIQSLEVFHLPDVQ